MRFGPVIMQSLEFVSSIIGHGRLIYMLRNFVNRVYVTPPIVQVILREAASACSPSRELFGGQHERDIHISSPICRRRWVLAQLSSRKFPFDIGDAQTTDCSKRSDGR